MVDCCELALYNGQLALRIALGAFALIALLLAMVFGYNLKLSDRTAKLEKKNGSEQKQLKDLQARTSFLEELHSNGSSFDKERQKLIEKYSKHKVEELVKKSNQAHT